MRSVRSSSKSHSPKSTVRRLPTLVSRNFYSNIFCWIFAKIWKISFSGHWWRTIETWINTATQVARPIDHWVKHSWSYVNQSKHQESRGIRTFFRTASARVTENGRQKYSPSGSTSRRQMLKGRPYWSSAWVWCILICNPHQIFHPIDHTRAELLFKNFSHANKVTACIDAKA